jgi:hypothetical protein
MLGIDLTDVTEGGVLAAGDYVVTCTDAEVRETKNGSGEYIKCVFENEDGAKIFHMFNTKNDNPKAVEIGMGQLKTFLRVANKQDPNKLERASELIGLRCQVKTKVREASGEYGPQAVITSFKAAPEKSVDNPF